MLGISRGTHPVPFAPRARASVSYTALGSFDSWVCLASVHVPNAMFTALGQWLLACLATLAQINCGFPFGRCGCALIDGLCFLLVVVVRCPLVSHRLCARSARRRGEEEYGSKIVSPHSSDGENRVSFLTDVLPTVTSDLDLGDSCTRDSGGSHPSASIASEPSGGSLPSSSDCAKYVRISPDEFPELFRDKNAACSHGSQEVVYGDELLDAISDGVDSQDTQKARSEEYRALVRQMATKRWREDAPKREAEKKEAEQQLLWHVR